MSLPIVARPVAYNPSRTPIPGTEQIGDLAVGTPTSGFTNNPRFWNGPNETQGYVIAYPVPAGDHPTPIFGVTAYLGFYGTKNMPNPLSESTFVELANNRFNRNFTSGDEASTWLTSNGYWNSWVIIGTTPTPTPSVTNTQTPTNTVTPTPSITPSTAAPSSGFTVTISEIGSNVVWSGSGSFNLTALTKFGTQSIGAGFNANQAIWAIGPSTFVEQYSGVTFTYPTSFGAGGTPVSSTSGSTFGVLTGPMPRYLMVPSGYTSNTFISGTAVYNNTTIAGMGLSAGTYTWAWGSGGNADSMTMIIGGAAVSPTPTPTNTETPTPTPTNTETPTPTPTNTETPTPTPSPAAASVVNMTLSQVGGNVVLSGAGTINLTSLNFLQNTFSSANLVPVGSQFGCGTAGPGPFNSVFYTGSTFTSPVNFGTGGQTVGNSGTGDFFGIGFLGVKGLFVPSGYISGSFISGTTTFNSTTLATLGATPGTYTWSWGSGATASSIIMTITP